MVEEIRILWCDALEELLQCPVCLDTTQGIKYQCVNGHHICSQCKMQLQICPICKSNFIVTRNLAVEQITAKLQDIKLSLLNPYHAINRRILKDKVCAATQTEDTYMPSTSSGCQTEPLEQVRPIKNEQQKPMVSLAPRVGKGSYPCRIGSCIMELPHGRIIGHLRYYHKEVFYECNTKNGIFQKKWHLEYIFNRDYDFAFHIKDMGLFFLNVSISPKGDLEGLVQIVNCTAVSKQFTYTLEIVAPRSACYTGPVKSCRIRRDTLCNERLHVCENNMRHLMDNKGFFRCNLIIRRRVDYRTIAVQDNQVPVRFENFENLFN